jgi:low affinity Fe/Cu permease
MKEWFRKIAQTTSLMVGSPATFFGAILVLAVWGLLGPAFGFSDTWQLAINTTTSVVTFLMVFLIQNSQNRDAKAIHLKLDELLRAVEAARTGMVKLEELSDEKLDELHHEFQDIRETSAPAAATPSIVATPS